MRFLVWKGLGWLISLLGTIRCAFGLPGESRPSISLIKTGAYFKLHKFEETQNGRVRCLTCGEDYLVVLKGNELQLLVLYPWEDYFREGVNIREEKDYCYA